VKKALIAAVLALGMAGEAQAVGGMADVTIYDRAEQRVLPVYYHAGRYYVAGRPGNEYQVNVRNNQPGEILSVVSVDGVNAVSGETANWSQTGYVLGSHMSFDIKGWRKSLQRVAAFFFTELENSYAARSGRPDNVGVIGVAVFRKKSEPAVGIYRDSDRRREAPAASDAAGAAQGSANEQDAAAPRRDAAAPPVSRSVPQPVQKSLGTGHGQSETSVVRYANFERASSTPDEVITIYYDSYRNLVAQGVIRDRVQVARPQPFPGQFVPDPR
jgi:opacity protein-like surface antigen